MRLRELVIDVGGSELRVNLGRPMRGSSDRTLYEGTLSDAGGTRTLWIDQMDLASCLLASPVLRTEPPAHAV